MSPWYSNCCSKFPWRYQRPPSGLVIGFGAISSIISFPHCLCGTLNCLRICSSLLFTPPCIAISIDNLAKMPNKITGPCMYTNTDPCVKTSSMIPTFVHKCQISPITAVWPVSYWYFTKGSWKLHMDGLVKDYSISIAKALEILQSCTKPSISSFWRSSFFLKLTGYQISNSRDNTGYHYYRKVSNIRRTLVGYKIVDHSDVVGASPVGAAPTTSSFST